MAEYIKRKVLVDLVLSKLKYLGDARIMNENDEKVLSEIDGYEKAIEAIHELILDKDLIEDVQPVKHGQWIETHISLCKWVKEDEKDEGHNFYMAELKCSCCERYNTVTFALSLTKPDFCQLCGAKMCGETTYKPITRSYRQGLEDIKTICSKRQHCKDNKKGNCQFYDKNSGYCIFDDMPEDWNIEENKEILKEILKEMEFEKNASKI